MERRHLNPEPMARFPAWERGKEWQRDRSEEMSSKQAIARHSKTLNTSFTIPSSFPLSTVHHAKRASWEASWKAPGNPCETAFGHYCFLESRTCMEDSVRPSSTALESLGRIPSHIVCTSASCVHSCVHTLCSLSSFHEPQ